MTARVDWRGRALAAEARVVALEGQLAAQRSGRPGRPRKSPPSEDTVLVARACAVLGVTRLALAERIGLGRGNAAVLSRAALPATQREALLSLLAQSMT